MKFLPVIVKTKDLITKAFLNISTNINMCVVFGLTRSGLEPMIYSTQDEYSNHYTNDAVVYAIHKRYCL